MHTGGNSSSSLLGATLQKVHHAAALPGAEIFPSAPLAVVTSGMDAGVPDNGPAAGEAGAGDSPALLPHVKIYSKADSLPHIKIYSK